MEKRLADFSDQQEIFVKTPTMQMNKEHRRKLNRQNWNKMGEDRQRKLAANINNLVLFRSFKQLFTIEKRWAIFSDRQKKKLKRLQCDWLKGHHRKLNRQNRNKMSEDRQRKLIANHQQFNKWIKQIIVDPNNTRRKQLMMIMSFSPFSFCWKFDYFQNKWRVARYKATIHNDKNYKRKNMTNILHEDVFQNPIAIIFICLWPHFEGSQ